MITVTWRTARCSTSLLLPITMNLILMTSRDAVQTVPVNDQFPFAVSGRSIRPIACKSKTGEVGVCMFALACTKDYGQHLGVCVDRFYFGSCCLTTNSTAFENLSTNQLGPINVSAIEADLNDLAAPLDNNTVPVNEMPLPATTPEPSQDEVGAIESLPGSGEIPMEHQEGESWTDIPIKATETPPPTTEVPLNTEGEANQFQYYLESGSIVCGRPKYPVARIVGGYTTHYGQWPWQISLRLWKPWLANFQHACGAALLNENWAITAAHCVHNAKVENILLRMGEYDMATEEEDYPYVERKVHLIASHPKFDSATFEYDLALLRFSEPVRFQPNIIPICLPEEDSDFVGDAAVVTGWGRLYEDGPQPSKMHQVTVPVLKNAECESMYIRAGSYESIPRTFICAGYAEGKRDACEGDSGGPMVLRKSDHWVLGGIISWGIGCAHANRPGVYTRITEFRHWISKISVF